MPYPKIFNHRTGSIDEATWMGKIESKEHCEYSTAPVIVSGIGKVTYQCRLKPDFIVEGHKACWRHHRMYEKGKKPVLFPPTK